MRTPKAVKAKAAAATLLLPLHKPETPQCCQCGATHAPWVLRSREGVTSRFCSVHVPRGFFARQMPPGVAALQILAKTLRPRTGGATGDQTLAISAASSS